MVIYRVISWCIAAVALLFAYMAGQEDAPLLMLPAGFFVLMFADAHCKVLEIARLDGEA